MRFAQHIVRSPIVFEADLGHDVAERFAHHGADIAEFLGNVAGCSPYLKGLAVRHEEWLDAALENDPDAAFEQEMAQLRAGGFDDLAHRLRVAKGRLALWIALADLSGAWSLAQVTKALSDFASLAVDLAINAGVSGELAKGKLPETDRPAGALTALAMGKMGAAELNYSSDIDLICVFDQDAYGDAAQDARPGLVRATRKMAATLNEITADGYVFRTDLRLRPDAAVTPVALSMAAAESYYESVGRTWERAAYIKARAAAGDVQV